MIFLIIVEIISIIDIYQENVAGKRYLNLDLGSRVYIVTGSNTGLGTFVVSIDNFYMISFHRL